ncbi:MAG: UDP-2,3-diacylglucosamine diphosphatase, partial [Calditrichia bacterium]|nr:UDP-2,3-diacylglucosamine diphosphatase [Calditrichia bacterium]
NGDLFDFWFEYKTVIPAEYLKILSQLTFLREKNIQIDYVAGNHDFWMRDFLTRELDIKIYKDEYTFDYDNKKFWVYHGDGIAKNDKGYRLMKKVFRNPVNIKLYSLLHPDWGIPLAKFISHSSRKKSKYWDLKDAQDYLDYSSELMNKGYDYVILGHRHKPLEHSFNDEKKYVNLGDWISHNSYAIYEDGELKLKYWKK